MVSLRHRTAVLVALVGCCDVRCGYQLLPPSKHSTNHLCAGFQDCENAHLEEEEPAGRHLV